MGKARKQVAIQQSRTILQDTFWTGLALIATGLLCLPFLMIHVRPLGHVKQNEQEHSSSVRFVFIPQPNPNHAERPAFRNLRAWLKLQRPELFWKPSVTIQNAKGAPVELGFLGLLPERPPIPLHPLTEVSPKMQPWSLGQLWGTPPTFDDQPLRREILAHWPPYFVVETPDAPERPLRHGVLWCNLAGHLMQDPPSVDAKAVEEALSKPPSVKEPTRITRLQLLPGPPVPRIVVRQSSGWPELDQLAVAALRQRIPAAFSQGEITLDVFWR